MQMGGGDSLYDKIDKGLRGCKVIISCVTSKYALSANCRREVSLADALKRPLVPLLLEETVWPPEGPMSLVFTHLLYINCCRPDVSIQDTWSSDLPQVQELLGKLRQHLPAAVKAVKAAPAPATATPVMASATPATAPATPVKSPATPVNASATPAMSAGNEKKSSSCNVL